MLSSVTSDVHLLLRNAVLRSTMESCRPCRTDGSPAFPRQPEGSEATLPSRPKLSA